MAKDTALDNLWNTTDDTYVYHTVGSPAKMVKKAGNVLTGKRTKTQGYMAYFLPKDKKGKVIGKPQKFLRIQKSGKTTNDFIPADLVTPYYEDIVKNKNYWISLGGRDVVARAQNRLAGIDPNAIASKFSGVGGTIDNVDDYGINTDLIDRGSLLNVSNSLDSINYSSISAVEKIGDPNTYIVDAETMNQAYQQSGSKTPFKDWLGSEGGKGVVNEFTKLVSALVNPQDSSVTTSTVPTGKIDDKDKSPKTETKILGMSPVTFGIVALGIIAIGSIVAVKMIKSKQIKVA